MKFNMNNNTNGNSYGKLIKNGNTIPQIKIVVRKLSGPK